MKKLAVLAMITAIGITGAALPVQAANINTGGYTVIGGQVSPEELKALLSEANNKLCDIQINWKDCPIITPPCEEQPGGDDQPGGGDNQPGEDGNQPGGDDNQPGEDDNQPGGDDNQPGDDGNRPGGDNNQPGGDNDQPGEDNQERTFAEQVVDLVNAERAKAGLGALTLDRNIESAALVRAKEIETSFSHTRPNGSSFSTVLTENGISYQGSGENIAWGQRTPEEVMNGWMNSEGHRANILNSRFTKIGVGYYQNSAGRNYWTQLFTY